MENFEEIDHQWKSRDSKKRAKKDFTSDNRKSVRWLYENSGEKAKDAKKRRRTENGMERENG